MKLELRPASVADQEFARCLHLAAYRDVVVRQFGSWDEEMQDKFFEDSWNPCEARIVQMQGRDIGLVQHRVHQDRVELVELQLLPEYQGRGIGALLLKEEQAAASGLGLPVKLRVLRESRAWVLYERVEFREVGSADVHILMQFRG